MSRQSIAHLSYEEFLYSYQLGKILGNGSKGVTYLIRSRQSHQEYALKLVSQRQSLEVEILSFLYQEKYLSHFAIVHFQEKEGYILPLIKGRTLSQSSLSLKERRRSLWQVLLAIYHLHHLAKPILMNDIYGENIILEKHIHLIDFGDSRWLENYKERWIDYRQWVKLYEAILPSRTLLFNFIKSLIHKEEKIFGVILHLIYYRYVYMFLILAIFVFVLIYQEV